MNDLHNRLTRFGGPTPETSADTIAADVARGHRAVRRRRTAQAAAGSFFSAAVIAAAVAFTGNGTGSGGPADTAPPVAADSPASIRLVEYRGAQPRYFTIGKVPEGYFVQNDDETGLTIAPDAVRDVPPGVDPSASPMYDPRMYTGKIGIFLERRSDRGDTDGEKVIVSGQKAVMHPIGTTMQLVITISPDVFATIQADVPLTREQILELGAGLHVGQVAIDRMAIRKN